MQAAQPRSIDTLDHQITLAMVGYHELHDEPGRTLARQRLNMLADLARHSHHPQTQIELVSWYLQYLSNFGWIGQPNPEILVSTFDTLSIEKKPIKLFVSSIASFARPASTAQTRFGVYESVWSIGISAVAIDSPCTSEKLFAIRKAFEFENILSAVARP